MRLDSFIGEKNRVSLLEISLCFVLFFFLLIRGTYRGALLPIMLFTLPHVILYGYASLNRNIKRETFNKLIFISFCIFYLGIKFYCGMDCLGWGSDSDDALYQSVRHFLNGEYPYDKLTFRQHAIYTGPSSILLSLPFVKFFNSIQVISVATILFLVIYLWRYVEKVSKIPILSLSLTLLVLTPFSNTILWAAEEELIYGLPFLYLSIIIFLNEKIKKDFIKDLLIGIFCGISLMVKITYLFPIAVILFFILLNKGTKNLIFALFSLIFTAFIIALPFIVMNPEHFIRQLPPLWFISDISFILQIILFFSAFIVLIYYYTMRKWPLVSQIHLLTGISLFIGYIGTGYLGMPWHALYWAIPFMISFPFLYLKEN